MTAKRYQGHGYLYFHFVVSILFKPQSIQVDEVILPRARTTEQFQDGNSKLCVPPLTLLWTINPVIFLSIQQRFIEGPRVSSSLLEAHVRVICAHLVSVHVWKCHGDVSWGKHFTASQNFCSTPWLSWRAIVSSTFSHKAHTEGSNLTVEIPGAITCKWGRCDGAPWRWLDRLSTNIGK